MKTIKKLLIFFLALYILSINTFAIGNESTEDITPTEVTCVMQSENPPARVSVPAPTLLNLVDDQETQVSDDTPLREKAGIPSDQIVEERESYFYSYRTGDLTYTHSIFYAESEYSPIKDYIYETVLN